MCIKFAEIFIEDLIKFFKYFFCRFQSRSDPKFQIYNEDAEEATKLLYEDTIPNFSRIMDSYDLTKFADDPNMFAQKLHVAGISIRHLGILYENSKSKEFKEYVAIEMISRSFKNILRKILRKMVGNGIAPQSTRKIPWKFVASKFLQKFESIARKIRGKFH
jgi:hypothetical protein